MDDDEDNASYKGSRTTYTEENSSPTDLRVYADPVTNYYHSRPEVAGDAPLEILPAQATLYGFEPCPTCYYEEGDSA